MSNATAGAVMDAPPTMAEALYLTVPHDQVHTSETNPRKNFDTEYMREHLRELSASIKAKGLIHPIVVRPHPSKPGYEIVAGECRFRSCTLAGLTEIPVIVREYTDKEVLELQLEENDKRKDFTHLERALGYRRLIDSDPTKHSVEPIASRVGKSPTWVWDYLQLNKLIPEAKRILDGDYMSVGHAILIARLKPEDQERAIAFDDTGSTQYRNEGLWRADDGFDFDEDDPANKGKRRPTKYERLKPCSVRELETWIRDHVRFDPAHAGVAQPLVFEETASQVAEAAAQPGRGKKVISITHSYRVADDARDEKERTYGSEAWVRADGQFKSKACEHSVLGVFVAGRGYGETLQVCVARDRCTVHFAKVIKARQAVDRARAGGKKSGESAQARRAREEEQRKAARAKEEAARKAWRAAVPSILEAITEKILAAKPATLGALLLRNKEARYVKGAAKELGAAKNAEDFLRTLVLIDCIRVADNDWYGPADLGKTAGPLGVDVGELLAQHGTAGATPAAAKTPAAKTARKKR